jgi:hypothetical protein
MPRVCHSCWQKQDCSECSHSRCSRDSSLCEPFQRTGCELVERIDCVEKMRLLSRATIQGRGGTRYVEGLAGAQGSVRNGSRKEMIVAVDPASFMTRSRFIVVSARDHGRRVSKKECTTRVMWLIASKLIRGRETF